MKADLFVSEIRIQSAHIPFLFNSPTTPEKVPSVSTSKVDSVPLSGPQRQGMKHVGTEGVMLFMPRSVQTRKGRLPSGKCCFILNTFPAATVSGLFSDTERLAHPPACTTSTGLTPSAVRLPNHSLCYQLHSLVLTAL